ncbi:flagellar protein FlgN [Bacillus salipaludis]|uniref:flagellar protein FlgN n=1 Tax=Bacillus salipaludis TaxID=2547811 RepID=UPI003D1FAB43
MESLKNLIQTLKALIDAHSRLLELAKEKRNVLIEGDVLKLQSLIPHENSCVEEIQSLELQRKRLVQDYLNQKQLPLQSLTFEELIKMVDDQAVQSAGRILTKQLRILIQEISNLNESNQQLIQTSLSYVQYSIEMLVRKEPAIGYGPRATNRYSHLLDAKV